MSSKTKPWVESSDVLSLFPTFVWKIQLEPDTQRSIGEQIVRIVEELGGLPSKLEPGTGWQSEQALHEREELRALMDRVDDAVTTVLEFLRVGHDEFETTGCWANVLAPGASHRAHSHPNNFLSGVYYVRVSPGADAINFHDPRVQAGIIRPAVTELTSANTDQVVVRVKPGTLLLFPAYVEHSVSPNASDEPRISVSFNVMFSSFIQQVSKPLW